MKKTLSIFCRLFSIGFIIAIASLVTITVSAQEYKSTIAVSSEGGTKKTDHENTKTETAGKEIGGGFLDDPSMIEKKPNLLSLNKTFPLWKSIAKGRALPRPVSMGLVTYWQSQDYDIVSATVGLGSLPPKDVNVSNTNAKIDTKSMGVKGGLWLFPFLNLHAGIGYSRTDSDIFLRDAPISVIPNPGPGEPTVITGDRLLELTFDGPYTTVGVTAVGGWNRWFGSLTLSYAYARLDASKGDIGTCDFTSVIAMPKFGYAFKGTSLWVGASWIDEKLHQEGSIDEFSYDVRVERTDWTPVVGMHSLLGEHWEFTVEGGFGDRTSAMFSLGYRF